MGAPTVLNYGRSPRFPKIHWRLLLKVAVACLLVAYAAMTVLTPDIRTTVSLCTKCGAYQTTTEHCLPLTSIAFRRCDTQAQTPMSLVVQKHQLNPSHQHQFVMASIRGRRQRETGPAAFLDYRVSHTPARFIDTLATYVGPVTAEEWLDRVLDPDRNFSFEMAMGFAPVPTNQLEFKYWWERVQTGKFSSWIDMGQKLDINFTTERLPKTSSSGQDAE
jgi:hypothetical protein